jgi:hypothetical protein
MKNVKMLLLSAFLIANVAIADAQQRTLTREQKARILLALQVLSDEGVIQYNEKDQNVDIDQSIIDDLMNQGLLKFENSKMHSICIGIEK